MVMWKGDLMLGQVSRQTWLLSCDASKLVPETPHDHIKQRAHDGMFLCV
jgi:hypothetical protein